MSAKTEPCSGCGALLVGGTAGCQSIMDDFLARDFSDIGYFRLHRMMVDTYCLQHPDRGCVSAKSFVAHFTGLCWALEHAGNRAVGSERLRRWLGSAIDLEKPEVPAYRGKITIVDVAQAAGAVAYAKAVEDWARCTWEAYSSLHSLAHKWIEQALQNKRP